MEEKKKNIDRSFFRHKSELNKFERKWQKMAKL